MINCGKRLEAGIMGEIDETIVIGRNIRMSLDVLKSKVNFGASQIVLPQVQNDWNVGKSGNSVILAQLNSKN